MNFGKAFSYVFDDKDWLSKVLVGGVFLLLSILIVPAFFLMGYLMELIKNAANGNPTPLPAWNNLGDKFVNGLKLFVVAVAWSIIIFIVVMVASFVTMRLPVIGGLIIFVLSMLLGFMRLIAIIFFSAKNDFAAAFDFSEILNFIGKNLMNLIIVLLLMIPTTIIVLAGLIGVLIGVIFTGFYGICVMGYLYGEMYRARNN